MTERLRRAFFEDLAVTEEVMAESARELLSSPEVPTGTESSDAVRILRDSIRTPEAVTAFETVVRDFVHTALHATLVSIDGGAASAEAGELDLIDAATGTPLGDALHELYVDYLFETERMT